MDTRTQSLNAPENFTAEDGYWRFRPLGPYTLVGAVDSVTQAIGWCRENKQPRLLLDLTRIYGFPVPTLIDRFWMAQDWAQASESLVIAAMVAHAHYIDPGKFGVRAARDAGLTCDVFTLHDEAIAWLTARTLGHHTRRTMARVSYADAVLQPAEPVTMPA